MKKVTIFRNIAKLSNIEMFYFDTKTQGPVILCLHGRCGRAETWYDFFQHYGNQYRIIAPDQRGHGLSSRPISNYTDAEMADDIVELLGFLHIDFAILVGHSMGGAVAGYLSALHPKCAKALAILDKSAAGPAKSSLKDQLNLSDPTKDWPLPFPSLYEAMEFLKQTSCSDLEYQYFMNSLIETVEGYNMMFSSQAIAIGIAHYTDWYCLLPKIQCPTLLIRSGSHEAVSDDDYSKMQSLIPKCFAREMSHPDHNVHLANKKEFYGYFNDFLNWISKA